MSENSVHPIGSTDRGISSWYKGEANVRKSSRVLILILISMTGMIAVSVVTQLGIGVSPDSTVYLGVANSLADGKGLRVPLGDRPGERLTHYPPLYPAVLSIPKILGLDLLAGARWINLTLFFANIVLVGLILCTLLPENFWLPLGGAFFTSISLTILNIHAMAWSEPLFVFCILSSILFLSRYLEREQTKDLAVSIVATALALLTRYAGISLVVTCGLAIMLWLSSRYVKRLAVVAVFVLFSILPLSVWMLTSIASSGTAALGRQILFHPPGKEKLFQLLYTLSDWLTLPNQWPDLAKAMIVAGILIGGLIILMGVLERVTSKQATSEKEYFKEIPVFVRISLLLSFVYLLSVFLSITFLDATIPLDLRILSPFYVLFVIIGAYAIERGISKAERNSPSRLGIAFLILMFCMLHLKASVQWIQEYRGFGLGYTSIRWRNSTVYKELIRLPDEMIIYSNAPEPIYLYTGKSARFLPRSWNAITKQINPRYSDELRYLKELMHQDQAVIVYFLNFKRTSLEEEQMLIQTMQLCLGVALPDARIYHAAGDGNDCLRY